MTGLSAIETYNLVSKKRQEQNRTNVTRYRERLAEATGRKQQPFYVDDDDRENMKRIKAKVATVKNQSDAIKYALAETVQRLGD